VAQPRLTPMTRCTLFASQVLTRLRSLGGRSRRLEAMLQAQAEQLNRMEKTMADNDSEVLVRLQQLQTQVNAWTTQKGQELAEAHKALADAEERGRTAQKEEDQQAAAADKQAQLDKIKEISDGLVSFEASGN
jgi:DNA repair exonuclease SbcCD ATPase subunit